MTLIGVRINNQNANGILINGYRISLIGCQFIANNETRNPAFSHVNGAAQISSSYLGNDYIFTNLVEEIPYFGGSGGNQDWNDLLNTFNPKVGVNYIADYYNAANRPSGAGTYLEGSITCVYGLTKTVYRTYIRVMDENGKEFVRYMNINLSSGAYTNDSGWKTVTTV